MTGTGGAEPEAEAEGAGGGPPGGAARVRRRRGFWATAAVRSLQVLLGLAVGLVVAEGLFRWRDRGAFPHLNLYVADPEVGLRLRPNAAQAVQFGGAAVTSVRTNSQGYRGGEWPPPGDVATGEVLVLGDSQAFGLGVEETETLAALLARERGGSVLNAGVPTWGPPE